MQKYGDAFSKSSSIFYITYISVDLVDHEIFLAKVGKGGINIYTIFRQFDGKH